MVLVIVIIVVVVVVGVVVGVDVLAMVDDVVCKYIYI